MEIEVLQAGYCNQIERIVKNSGKFKTIKFPATFILINHPDIGYILFDTGYSEHVIESMKAFPHNIYGKITPVVIVKGESAREQLINRGIDIDFVKYIILSHFHADHIGGCNDFPNAKFICSKKDYNDVKVKTGFSALKSAFIPELLPSDFEERVSFIEDKTLIETPVISKIFTLGYDIFNDRSIVAVNLPGHTQGQFGIFLKTEENYFFFISDACWQEETYKELDLPSKIAKVIMTNYNSYLDNIYKLDELYKKYPHVKIVATHE